MRDQRSLSVDGHEFGLIVTGLRRVRTTLLYNLRRDKETGFQLAPGKKNVNELRYRTLVRLMDRLGIEHTEGAGS